MGGASDPRRVLTLPGKRCVPGTGGGTSNTGRAGALCSVPPPCWPLPAVARQGGHQLVSHQHLDVSLQREMELVRKEPGLWEAGTAARWGPGVHQTEG